MTTAIEFTPTYTIKTVAAKVVVGGDNYFRGSDIEPTFNGTELTIIDGYGERRYWGTPSVRSNVTKLADDVLMVQVTGWHKHTKNGPVGGNYYFVFNHSTGNWDRKTANHKSVKSLLAERQTAAQ